MQNSESLPNPANLPFADALYASYLEDPSSVTDEWRAYFQKVEEEYGSAARVGPRFQPASLFRGGANGVGAAAEDIHSVELQEWLDQLIRAYRTRGHEAARLDPLGRQGERPPELDPAYYGFSDSDLAREFSCQSISERERLPLRDIIRRLEQVYCGSIGVEYMHINDKTVRRWLQKRLEGAANNFRLDRETEKRIYTRLSEAVNFEEFIHRKFIGAKSFSLEGCESLIPLLDLAIEKCGELGVEQIVMGMAHRGRLNVLSNILGKHPSKIFREFEDKDPQRYIGQGDVKYHLGFSSDWQTSTKKNVHLSLCFNPSHLEFVNPVVMGRVRAKQDRKGDKERRQVMGLLIHGDAAFIGEGVVQETLNMSALEGYSVRGILHIIVNNQIGFTTSPHESRSSVYATDVARMLQIPIFHVNGEDPEAVAQVIDLAMDFREAFHMDLVIDMYGYRKLGHNESDEPSFTQPLMYREISGHEGVRERYLKNLVRQGEITQEEGDEIWENTRKMLETELSRARSADFSLPAQERGPVWKPYHGGPEVDAQDVPTQVDRATLNEVFQALTTTPDTFKPHPKMTRFLENRRRMAKGEQGLDWAAGEALAFGTLLLENHAIRLSGQDSRRGTFSHRHAVLFDYETGDTYTPLAHIRPQQAAVEIVNSPLSEAGVLGFDYGYSLDVPTALVMWEAQFGDFVNAAQVIIDQFISSAEDKWRILSGLVMLLPHGFEGQGPEHSSARLERFLNLCAEDNMQVAQPSTPAQYFHLLRRQTLRAWRKPLIVMTPKSLLRRPEVASPLEAFTEGAFQKIIPDIGLKKRAKAKKILICSGRIYYDLQEKREELGRSDVAILRMEQLYPFPAKELEMILKEYGASTPVFWVQDEPENMGAWWFVRMKTLDIEAFAKRALRVVSRPESASPATGSNAAHKQEQAMLLEEAFA